jgi:hypothetical protein
MSRKNEKPANGQCKVASMGAAAEGDGDGDAAVGSPNECQEEIHGRIVVDLSQFGV